jgi:hypothetical protein
MNTRQWEMLRIMRIESLHKLAFRLIGDREHQKQMKTFIAIILWFILLVICWPIALIVLFLFPIIWLILLPFRIVGLTIELVFKVITAILLFPFRLLRAN